jgi:hypothetical protein
MAVLNERLCVWAGGGFAFLALLACAPSDREEHPAEQASMSVSAPASYVLVSIDRQPLQSREQASATCSQLPFSSWYVLDGQEWKSTDSVFTRCGERGRAPAAVAVTTGGSFTMRGDTVDFFVSDTTIGERGLVGRGLLHGDTLVSWGGDLDGGDYLYVKQHASHD